MNRRQHLQLALLGGLMPSLVWANSDRVIGVVSLVADFMTVTGFEAVTGTRVRSNPTERIDLPNDDLEKAVLRSALSAINQTKAGKAVPLLFNDSASYSWQSRAGEGDTANIPARIRTPLEAQKATHLLLVSKHRGEARMDAGISKLGTGAVEGIGFYIDRVTNLTNVETRNSARGYLAPYFYVRVSLIDLRDNKVQKSKLVMASDVVDGIGKAGADPWNFLDNAGKMKAITDLIEKDCLPVMKEILA